MKIAICTLGCKVNQYETQAMESELVRRGHTLVPFENAADAYIINTCAVTAVSGHKSRQMVRQAKKRSPAAAVAVCGCYAQTDPETVAALGVDLVSGSAGRMAFLDDLERLAEKKLMSTSKAAAAQEEPREEENIMSTRTFEELPAGGLEGRTRAMLKVEDGCVNFCSYCIIPYARGPVRSLPPERAVEEAKTLQEKGYKEIVLTGIEISSWGRDLPGKPPLAELIAAVCAAAPGCRIRLGSLEPRTIDEAFCRKVSGLPNLCPHFHLSLQSGCDETLKRMNRKYDTARYYESVELLRKYYGNPGITTDLITGFPGETEEEFGETLDFLRKCGFTAMHIFPYSRRPGTPADKMPGQVPNAVKEERARRAAAVAAELQRAYLQSLVGQCLPVLFEEEKDGSYPQGARRIPTAAEPPRAALWRGHAPNYAEVFVPSAVSLHNVEKTVHITGVEGTTLRGECVK